MIRITFDIPDEFRSPNTAAASMSDTPPFPDLSALELVAKAQREFESGDDRQWAASLWAAVHKTFLHLACQPPNSYKTSVWIPLLQLLRQVPVELRCD